MVSAINSKETEVSKKRQGIKYAKALQVLTGPIGNQQSSIVKLNGVLPEEKLTPRMARRAARVAQGTSAGTIVWDKEYGHGYRLYKNSARKLHQDRYGIL